jgi:NAD(P)-dependent dehydrogenase (short-subunit alcohol dehydrogenase family)
MSPPVPSLPTGSLSIAANHAFVAGGTSGIGRAMAATLAGAGWNVTVAGRRAEAATALQAEVAAAGGKGSISFRHMDGFDLSSVRAAVTETVAEADQPVSLLVLSQGMATLQGYTPTKDGLDEKLQLHYYSRIAATLALLEAQPTQPLRVLSVLSGGIHSAAPSLRTDPFLRETYGIKAAADTAGAYNDLGFARLAELRPDSVFVHASPGFVKTAWGTEMPWIVRTAVRTLQVFGRPATDCARYLLSPLLSLSLSPGLHIFDQYGKEVPPSLVNKEDTDILWAHTKEALGLKCREREREREREEEREREREEERERERGRERERERESFPSSSSFFIDWQFDW